MSVSTGPWLIQATNITQRSQMPNSAARGIAIGLVLSVACWLLLLLIVVHLVR